LNKKEYELVVCELFSNDNLTPERKKELEKLFSKYWINFERKEKLKHLNNL